MTHESGGTVVPRVYSANELGVLSLIAPEETHPRVEYIGGEVFVGLNAGGTALTRAQAEELPRPFAELVAASVASASVLPDAVDGVVLIKDDLSRRGSR